jgi:NAD(P)-dependent dehydrogenase (short-subunit alcohol dehydrogenase family)
MARLEGRVAIVTGAGRGIGASLARIMAGEGAAIVVNDLGVAVDGTGSDQSPAAQVAQSIVAAGGTAVADYSDISDHTAAEKLVQHALDEFGKLDVVVNVAGILRDRMVFNMSEQEWDDVVRVHMKGTFNTTKFATIHWRKAREGHYRLINFSSGSGLHGAPGQPNYAAAKMGIVGFTYSCARALGPYGITANAISPGASTRMTATVPDGRRRAPATADDPRRSPDNIAPPVVYLASTRSDWLTGQVIAARGFQISLYNKPEVIAEVTSEGPWDMGTAFDAIEREFTSKVPPPRS